MGKADNYLATYEDYEKLINEDEDNLKYEYLNGCIYLLASGTYEHCRIQAKISRYIDTAIDGKPCDTVTELDLHTSTKDFPNQVVRPDIMVICDRENIQDGKYSGVPTVVVEIVSKSSVGNDYFTKANLYRMIGVKEYYIVDPLHKKITVYTYDKFDFEQKIYRENGILQSSIFEKLKLDLKEIFQPIS